MGLAVIIPSKTPGNLFPCVSAVKANDPDCRIMVINDGLTSIPNGVEVVDGIKPFVFARNVNLGIKAAGRDDVILLNDDALLQTPRGFSAMSESGSGWGLVSAANNCGSGCQRPQGNSKVRLVATHVPAFVCVFIPRETIDAIGILDERFTAYGYDDNDYVRRARMAGLRVGVFDGCFVDHRSLRSTFRGDPLRAGDISEGRKIYEAKWGVGVN